VPVTGSLLEEESRLGCAVRTRVNFLARCCAPTPLTQPDTNPSLVATCTAPHEGASADDTGARPMLPLFRGPMRWPSARRAARNRCPSRVGLSIYIHTQYTSTLILKRKRMQQCETQSCKPSFLTAGKLRRSRPLTHIQIHIHNENPLLHTLTLRDFPMHTHRASQAALSATLGQMPSWMLSVY
jgi:hypothetical protein